MKKILPILLIPFLMVFLCVGNAMAFDWALGNYVEEDYVRYSDGYVGPGWGGQDYDVERLGLYEEGGYVYFGLQTGFDLGDLEVDGNYAGDFALDTDGNGSFDHAINISYNGGFNMKLYEGGTWQAPDYFGKPGVPVVTYGEYPFQMNSDWTYVSDIFSPSLSTGKDNDYNSTWILVGSFLQSDIFGYSGEGMRISWTMQCGNDVLQYSSRSVPEPATMLLLGTGLIGLAGLGRKKYFK